MEKFFKLLSKTKHAWICALVGFLTVCVLQTVSITLEICRKGLNAYNFGVFLFELFFCGLTAVLLIMKKKKLVLFMLCVFKVYDGVHYPLVCLKEIVEYKELAVNHRVGFIFFMIASLFLFLAFLCFLLEHLFEKELFWNIMKLMLLLSSIALVGTFVFYLININFVEGSESLILMEPLCLAVLNVAMFFGCNYVED